VGQAKFMNSEKEKKAKFAPREVDPVGRRANHGAGKGKIRGKNAGNISRGDSLLCGDRLQLGE
jgi:hypothetical protein